MTLRELSEQLGLSPATVSRALSRPQLVAEKTRQLVVEAAAAHGYTPNAIARSLKDGRTRAVGIIVSDIQNPFYSSVVRAIERVAASRRYNCVICNSDEEVRAEERALDLLVSLQVAGVIYASTGVDHTYLQRLQRGGLPLVEIDRASGTTEVDAVLVDNVLGARLAAEHLLDLGHRKLAIITGPQTLTTGRERLAGFRAALEVRGVALSAEYSEISDFREAGGYSAALKLLALEEPPTALFVTNNEMMAGTMAALRERGVRVPTDISLISFDDVRWARYVEAPLTVIAQPTEQIGTLAAGLLFERLAGRHECVHYVLKPELVLRASCAPPTPTSSPGSLAHSLHNAVAAAQADSGKEVL